MRKFICVSASALALGTLHLSAAIAQTAGSTASPASSSSDAAVAFGAREAIESISLSPDGRAILYSTPTAGQGSRLYTVNLDGTQTRLVAAADGVDQRLAGCEFVSTSRLVCTAWTIRTIDNDLVPISRLISLNTDGSDVRVLGERDTANQHYLRTATGSVIDWLPGQDNALLMAQNFIPDTITGSRVGRSEEGLGVVQLDVVSNRQRTVESPRPDAIRFVSDGRGRVRIMATRAVRGATQLDANTVTYSYRPAEGGPWRPLGQSGVDSATDIRPVAVDPDLNAAYIFARHNGRMALFRMALDGSMRRELVASHPQVDVDGLVRVGRRNRVVGVSFATDRRQVTYFDPELKALAERLHRALPNLPLINFADASEDEQILLIWAGSDTDPGRYYSYNKAARNLNELMLVRPQLENVAMAPVRSVNYRAADGTSIPAYLTLPPGGTGRGLPAIVMPHGGPSARDEWGFDWLAQYYANRGYAVLQPNFRGSSGYGEAWFLDNGFVSWRTAIGDINDAGRWLAAEGIADPAKLAIVGWSYGGYAALQSNVLDPALYKAIVAIAPVTDLDLARNEWAGFTNAANVRDFFGRGAHIREGSPLQNVEVMRSPVLMFHGDRDRNVGIGQARAMDRRLRGAGKTSELVTYPGLDHQLHDSAARADMLRRSDAFLRQALGIR